MEDYQTAEGVKEEVLDYGFVEVDTDVHQLCTACLCATRTTHTLDDVTLKQYYMNILTETQLEAGAAVSQSPCALCWECVAHLKRSVRFREQVQDSYRLLQPMLLLCDKEELPEFLHTSVRRPGRLRTCFAHSIDISAHDDDTQLTTATEHDDDNAAAEEYLLVKNSEVPLSTSRETKTIDEDTLESFCDKNIVVCVSEDLDEQSNESLAAQTRKQVKPCATTTTNTPNSTHECSHNQCGECSHGRRLLQHIDMKTNAAEEHHQRESLQNQPLIHNKPNSKEKRFQCNVCHKSFLYKSVLIMHTRTHTGEKPFQCEVCYKSFALKSNLIGHRRIHTGEKPFQCEMCSKSFALQSDLIKHRRTHTGEKPYQCEVCHKSFVQHCILIDHRRIHTGEKPFQCEVCPKSFARQGDLNTHRRTHTGEKPFLCEICLKSFARINNLVRHRRAHTSEKPVAQ